MKTVVYLRCAGCEAEERGQRWLLHFHLRVCRFIIGPVNKNGFQYGPVTRRPDGPASFRTICSRLRAAGSSEPRARLGQQTSGRFWHVHWPKASDIPSP